MPKIIIYANKNEKEKIANILKDTNIEIVNPQGLTKYQQERSFVYGDSSYGHAVAVVYISGEESIPFGVLSADINKKNLPIIVYVENTDKAKKIKEDFFEFLSNTHININKQFEKTGIKINSFRFESNEANYRIVYENEAIRTQLIDAINSTYSKYVEQPKESRIVRPETIPPTEEKLEEKRQLFLKKEGFLKMANSLDEFKSHLTEKNKPNIAFLGAIYPSSTNICEWASELGNCNLIYGLMGFDKNKEFLKQSMMYQFAYYAKKGGCDIYGTIPYEQVHFGESADFSKLGIISCYIAPQLQERIQAFNSADLFIVGSTGTGTYEEVFSILDNKKYFIIINEDGYNTPLAIFLEKYKDKYPNIFVATNQKEFKVIFDIFLKQQRRIGNFSTSSNFYQSSAKENLTPDKKSDSVPRVGYFQ